MKIALLLCLAVVSLQQTESSPFRGRGMRSRYHGNSFGHHRFGNRQPEVDCDVTSLSSYFKSKCRQLKLLAACGKTSQKTEPWCKLRVDLYDSVCGDVDNFASFFQSLRDGACDGLDGFRTRACKSGAVSRRRRRLRAVSCDVAKTLSRCCTPSTTTTMAPNTEAPATEAPATETPATEAPATETPATEAPPTEAPATESPATETPATETPATEAPPPPPQTPPPQVPDPCNIPGVLQCFAGGCPPGIFEYPGACSTPGDVCCALPPP